ncbi:hypothetical protein BGZ65_011186, partial [Modicella reniformis]
MDIVYDNINFALRKYDAFECGTTATIVIGDALGIQEQLHDPYQLLHSRDFNPTQLEGMQHFKGFCRFHLVDVLKRRSTSYRHCSTPVPQKDQLPQKKMKRYPLPSMPINQSSIEDNMDVLETILIDILKLI